MKISDGTSMMGIMVAALILGACAKEKNPYEGRKPNLSTDLPTAPVATDPSSPQSDTGSDGVPDVTPVSPADYDWRTHARLSVVESRPFQGQDFGSLMYRDVAQHGELSRYSDPATTVHQSLHEIHRIMRGKRANKEAFIYFSGGLGQFLAYPEAQLSEVRKHVGLSFRGLATLSYDTYLVSQAQTWKNPLYLFDEWRSVAAGARTALEVTKAGQWTPAFSAVNADPYADMVALMYFASASLATIESADPDYFERQPEFKALFAMISEESLDILNQTSALGLGTSVTAFQRLENLRTADDAEAVRCAIIKVMGSTWAERVLPAGSCGQ